MILLANPSTTDKILANGSTQILMPHRPAILINSNFNHKMRHIVTEGTDINGFILPNCELEVLSFHVRNTKCGGNLFNRQQDNVGKCVCYQMPNRSGNVIISIEVKVVLPDGNTISTCIRSKWFLEKFILTRAFPVGTRAENFEDYEIKDRLYSAIHNVMKYLNLACKFQIIGWAKRGELMDQGVAPPS